MTDHKLAALVVDDESLGRERVRALLSRRNDIAVAAEATNGDEAVDLLRADAFDLVFLDIQMPRKSGFEVIQEVGTDSMPPVIFVTAFDEHALAAFEVHAIDYLLKPFSPERFDEAVDRALALRTAPDIAELTNRMQGLISGVAGEARPMKRILVRTGDRIEFVDVADIDWIEAAGNYANLHVGNRSLLIRQTMKSLEKRLDVEQFMRIHRSTIVNIDRIKDVHTMFNGDYEVRLTDGTRLTLSRGFRHALDRFS